MLCKLGSVVLLVFVELWAALVSHYRNVDHSLNIFSFSKYIVGNQLT